LVRGLLADKAGVSADDTRNTHCLACREGIRGNSGVRNRHDERRPVIRHMNVEDISAVLIDPPELLMSTAGVVGETPFVKIPVKSTPSPSLS